MNTESLRITLDDGLWDVDYVGYAETPVHPTCPDGDGWNEVGFTVNIQTSMSTLYSAERFARSWGEGSGFKCGPLKISHSNVLEIKLRRP